MRYVSKIVHYETIPYDDENPIKDYESAMEYIHGSIHYEIRDTENDTCELLGSKDFIKMVTSGEEVSGVIVDKKYGDLAHEDDDLEYAPYNYTEISVLAHSYVGMLKADGSIVAVDNSMDCSSSCSYDGCTIRINDDTGIYEDYSMGQRYAWGEYKSSGSRSSAN